MRRAAPIIALVLICFTVLASTPSYWFSQWQVKPDAQQAQQFFMLPGANINFTYGSNHVIINATGGIGPPGPAGPPGANGTNGVNGINGTNGVNGTNGANGTNAFVSGLTTNFALLFEDTGLSNTVFFSNGLLVAITPFAPAIPGSIILPGGGYLIQPGGGTLLLP